ncbi:Septin-domain-containing protein [Radiomyces spectabilis]|uniref:Septin-domain-containing protein n=1 Tax=Radiomyces spectabilis TaxID=64574 RepID=UPI00221EEA20|nr:Septin-domain-containing protein [Radiomyces spectabilis]KAI8371508.1 Septin-domain-containing protein [Radiomyces spectabilis]
MSSIRIQQEETEGLFPDLGPWKNTPVKQAALTHPLGMDALPRQNYEKAKREPFRLNVIVVGETGLGKSTFLNTLFNTDLKEPSIKQPEHTETVEITPVTYELEEDGVTMLLSVIDTPGFGDRLDRTKDLEPILEYIQEQNRAFHQAERSAQFRRKHLDTRVHACLYFIAPTGHSMKEMDIVALRAIASKVNVIPVIAKADGLTKDETISFKKTILEDLEKYGIPIYPTSYPNDRDPLEELEKHIPFAVIGSNDFVEVDGKKVRGREYRWGSVQVENPDHCDFVYLREMLMIHCLHELSDITHDHHYHAYRAHQLTGGEERPQSLLKCDEEYDARIDTMKSTLVNEMSQREEEIRQQFVQKVRETEQILKNREEELQRKRDELKRELEQQKQQLDREEHELNEWRDTIEAHHGTIRRK